MGNLYCQDNATYRQFLVNKLNQIMLGIESLENLDATNIKSGVELLGNTGTYTNEDAGVAVTALDIAEGKVAYVNGQKIVGVAGIAEYALTVGANTGTGTGSVTVDGDAYINPVNYKAGSEVELVATADAGSVFVNWTIGGVEVGTEATYTHTMEKEAVTIVANFDLEGGE